MKKQTLTILCAMVFLTNCANEEAALEINGSYASTGTSHTISNDSWVQDFGTFGTYTFNIVSYNNSTNIIIAQNGAANGNTANLFSKINYTDRSADGKFYFCSAVSNASSIELAIAATDADASNPGSSGCGGFSWSQMTSGTGIN